MCRRSMDLIPMREVQKEKAHGGNERGLVLSSLYHRTKYWY